MRRMILLAIAVLMVAAMTAGAALAAPPPGGVPANDEAQGSFFTASGKVLGDPPNPNSRNAEKGIDTAHFKNYDP